MPKFDDFYATEKAAIDKAKEEARSEAARRKIAALDAEQRALKPLKDLVEPVLKEADSDLEKHGISVDRESILPGYVDRKVPYISFQLNRIEAGIQLEMFMYSR